METITATVKQLRFIHVSLVALCATLFVAVISPDDKHHFEQAVADLQLFNRLNTEGGYSEYAAGRVSGSDKDIAKVRAVFDGLGIQVTEHSFLHPAGLMAMETWDEHSRDLKDLRRVLHYQAGHGVSNATIARPNLEVLEEHLKRHLDSAQIVAKMEDLFGDDVKRGLFPQIPKASELKLRLERLIVDRRSNRTDIIKPIGSTGVVFYIVELDQPGFPRFWIDVGAVPCLIEGLSDATVEKWLQGITSEEEMIRLRRAEADGVTLLPRLDPVWDLIQSDNSEDAAIRLQAELRNINKATLEILGIKVPTKLVDYLGPIALLLLLLSLTGYCRQLQTQITSVSQLENLPLMPASRQPLLKIISVISIMVLPVVVMCCLAADAILRRGQIGRFIWLLACAVGVLTACLFAASSIRGLHRSVSLKNLEGERTLPNK